MDFHKLSHLFCQESWLLGLTSHDDFVLAFLVGLHERGDMKVANVTEQNALDRANWKGRIRTGDPTWEKSQQKKKMNNFWAIAFSQPSLASSLVRIAEYLLLAFHTGNEAGYKQTSTSEMENLAWKLF